MAKNTDNTTALLTPNELKVLGFIETSLKEKGFSPSEQKISLDPGRQL
jgi:hypothetical protein